MSAIPPNPNSPEELAIIIISALANHAPLVLITAIMAWAGTIHIHRRHRRANRINRRDDKR